MGSGGDPIPNVTWVRDGEVIWTARTPANIWLKDGELVWACRLHSVFLRTQAVVRDCRIYRFTNAGVTAQSTERGVPPSDFTSSPQTNLNQFVLENLWIYECGVGIAVRGRDASQGLITQCQVTNAGQVWRSQYGNPFHTGGVGIWDASYTGCNQLSNLVEFCTGHAYVTGMYDITPSEADDHHGANPGAGQLFGCYQDGGQLPPFAFLALIVGGNFSPYDSLPRSGGQTIGGALVGGTNNIWGKAHGSAKQIEFS